MKAFVFPGQGSQFPGMGKDLYESSAEAKALFDEADEVLGFSLSKVMFEGTEEELKQTHITQPAVFLHSCAIAAANAAEMQPDMVAGHSLGEFSALVANKTIAFKDALILVSKRAKAMQKACEANPSTMAAILGLEDAVVEEACNEVDGVVVAANYNSPGQVVISGENEAIDKACEILTERGAKRALKLPVGGAFHSPLMEIAREELAQAIEETTFNTPICPVYQNVTASAVSDPAEIKANLNKQLTAPVKWTQTMNQMIEDGMTSYTEVGPGKVLQGLIKKVDRAFPTASL
ncbi:MAG: ACP S-malonyltransferase [Bacteroidetes bacterium]|nr:ACP S-malonyltransferase [Bacteroidota bacterium]